MLSCELGSRHERAAEDNRCRRPCAIRRGRRDREPEIFSRWERIVGLYQVTGKQAHDARIVAAMSVHGLTHLLTFNDRDFRRFTEITVVNPQDIISPSGSQHSD